MPAPFRRIDDRGHQAHRSRRRSRRVHGRRTPARPRSPERLEDRPRQRFVPRCQTPRFRSPRARESPRSAGGRTAFARAPVRGARPPGSMSPTATTTSSFSNGAAIIRSTTSARRAPREPMAVSPLRASAGFNPSFMSTATFSPRGPFRVATRRILSEPGAKPPDLLRGASHSLLNSSRRFCHLQAFAINHRMGYPIFYGFSNRPRRCPARPTTTPATSSSTTRSLRFIEFSKIGWDWPERRLTQYTTSHGAGRPDGRTVSALTPALTARYAALASETRAASQTEITALLDGHHFIFHLLAAQSLLDALPDPRHPLLSRWRNPKARLAQLRQILETPLSADPRTAELRSMFER